MEPDDLRAAMPVTDRVAYLNTGATGPSPTPVVEAATDFQTRFEDAVHAETNPYYEAADVMDRVRERVADLLGVGDRPNEVALTGSTTDGINLLAAAMPLSAGDTVVRTDVEHGAGTLPWRRLADTRGIDVRVVETDHGHLEVDALAAVLEATDPELVVLSAVEWEYGRRLPVRAAAEVAHDAGARVLVDAVQAVGQVPVDVDAWGADFLAAAGHKWLLGPWGAGFLHVRPEAADWLAPERIGYRCVQDPASAGSEYDYREGARKLEVGTTNPSPYVGLERAIDLHESVGLDAIQARIERLTDRLKAGLDDDRLLSARECQSGLVSVSVADPETVVEALDDAGIVVRDIPGTGCVRASVHAFNTAEEVDRLLAELDAHLTTA
jgi:selenocysteine lyase/cysteine desulfurase